MDEQVPRLIEGGLHVDERGVVSFVNDFDFAGVRRFYMIRAHRPGQQRGWIGHRKEAKWFVAAAGTVLVAVVRPDDWEKPSRDLPVQRFVLSAVKPAVLHVPAGHATGSVGLTDEAVMVVYSSVSLNEAKGDDWRYEGRMWSLCATSDISQAGCTDKPDASERS